MKKTMIRDSSVALRAFNNPKCSDIVFLVNETKYYAYRNFVAGASPFFQTLLEGEFKESSQKEISLNNVMEFEENFLTVLKFIHGFEIDLEEFFNLQVCELLHLTEYFDLASLGDQVHIYLENLDYSSLDFDSVVALINIAHYKSYDILYKTCETFIYANAEQFLSQPTFLELDYDVLMALLKSNTFYANEFNIFLAVLAWFDANSVEMTSSATGSDTFDVVKTDTKDTSEDEGIEKTSPPGTPGDVLVAAVPTKLTELIKQIRNPQMDLFGLYKSLKNEDIARILHKYQAPLTEICGGSTEKIPCAPRTFSPVIFNVTVNNLMDISDGFLKSPAHLIKNLKWKLKVKWSKQTGGVNVFLKCTPRQETWDSWECKADCNVAIVMRSGAVCSTYHMRYPQFTFSPDSDEICKAPLINLDTVISSRGTYLHSDQSFKIRVTICPQDPVFQ